MKCFVARTKSTRRVSSCLNFCQLLSWLYGYKVQFAYHQAFHCVYAGQSGLCVFYGTPRLLTTPSMNSCLASRQHYSLDHTFHTNTINKTHSQKTKSPSSHTTAQIYHVFVLENHRHDRAKGCRSDHAFWQSLSSSGVLPCDPLSGPIPDYPATAAGVAEWFHYVSEVPDERSNGSECGLIFTNDVCQDRWSFSCETVCGVCSNITTIKL